MTVSVALRFARERAKRLSAFDQRVTKKGEGFGEAGTSDTEIAADGILAADILQRLLQDDPHQRIFTEGHETYEGPEPTMLRAVDPLDGSLNFRRRTDGSQGLPFCSVIAEFNTATPTFSDVSVAGVVDLRNGDLWYMSRGMGLTVNGKPQIVSEHRKVSKKAGTFIIADTYYPATRTLIDRGFPDFQGYIRSPGAAGYELACVASGLVDAFISTNQKCDVLGAGYGMITEAGGVVYDMNGKDIGPRPFVFSEQLSIVAAATHELAMEIIERIRGESGEFMR